MAQKMADGLIAAVLTDCLKGPNMAWIVGVCKPVDLREYKAIESYV
jgi:hypothetical protein